MSRIISNNSWAGSGTVTTAVRQSADGRNGFWNRLRSYLAPRRESRPQWPNSKRNEVFRRTCAAVRAGQFSEARTLLESAIEQGGADAALQNLLGVVYEAQRNWRQARKHYGKAIRTDGNFAPARQNMRRWYELFTFGRTEHAILLGD